MQITTIRASRPLVGVSSLTMRVEDAPPRLRTRSGPRRPSGLMLVGVAFVGLLAAAGTLAARAPASTDDVPAAVAAPPHKPAWLDVNRPLHLFELSGSEFGRLPLGYHARRRELTGDRRDVLTYGRFGADAPFLALSVLRKGAAPLEPTDFFVTMVRLAGETDLSVTRTALPVLLPSRFGDFETADLTLSAAATSVSCLGFRLKPDDSERPVDMAGFACRSAGKGLDRALLACVLDRIDLVSAGDDQALQAFFVEAERRRVSSCGPSQLLAAGSRPLWLDGDATAPSMRHLPGSRVR